MTSADENDAMTPQRLSQDLDEIAGLAFVSDNDGDRSRSKRAIGALANEVSGRLDALYAKAHDALEGSDKLSRKAGKEVSWIAVWSATALLPIIASALTARRFGRRNVITASVLAALMILGIIEKSRRAEISSATQQHERRPDGILRHSDGDLPIGSQPAAILRLIIDLMLKVMLRYIHATIAKRHFGRLYGLCAGRVRSIRIDIA